ncbi:hypothetical protein [Aeromicrobium wangtongii]|uniref:hypothetical protein n=1 Tax=Aeromicrobium wangtongii TaxID=2969247 RepID=UPI0020177779|nr:hypothetical protein [Aeromicrobium wangtongii]MCL3818194.1 hypothetical protein [Aeromicrobium wangtongii]
MDDVLRMSEAVARFGLGKVRNDVDRGLWQKPCRGVVLLHNGPITPDQHLAVALASAAPGAALGGLTALGLDGFDGFEAERPQIVLPSGARRPSLPGLEVRWSTDLVRANEIVISDGPRTDLSALTPSEQRKRRKFRPRAG